jgi:hypothetical protein
MDTDADPSYNSYLAISFALSLADEQVSSPTYLVLAVSIMGQCASEPLGVTPEKIINILASTVVSMPGEIGFRTSSAMKTLV